MEPSVVRTVAELDDALMPSRLANSPVGYVPTMGGLHAGHARLFRSGIGLGDVLVASVFVNPTQFGAGEDLDRYPRSLDHDLEVCSQEKVDIVFVPEVETIYPSGFHGVTVDPGPLADAYEGTVRPGHFAGVLTVMAKLFALVHPTHAVFGQKDYQQLVLIEAMVRDFCLGIDVIGAETVRESDGLALSSRNRYLNPAERTAGLSLSRALNAGAARAPDGAKAVVRAAQKILDAEPGLELDYLALTDPHLGSAPVSGSARLLVAGRVGSARLIDNIGLELGEPGTGEAP